MIYERAGVIEYIAWQVNCPTLRWNRLNDGRYVEVKEDRPGQIRSSALPGLWLPISVFAERDLHRVFADITEGVASIEHHRFMTTILGT